MCTCASCSYTDEFAGKGFAEWPKGEPKGPRVSAAEYSAHVSHGWHGVARGWKFTPGAAPSFPAWCRPAPALPYPSKLVADFIASGYKKAAPARARTAAPASPARPADTSPALDRQRGAGRIYAMPERQPKVKGPKGRPPIPGRRVVVKLEERHIKRAAELGAGKVAAGIRAALG